jgi:hypothetical protein
MRRIISVLAVAALVALMVAAMAMPAFAKWNPNEQINPYAEPNGEPACVTTYKGPSDPPGSSARGGNPGFQFTGHIVGAGC